MKKVLFSILLFSIVTVYAQKEKKYILHTDFGYSYSHKDMLDAGTNHWGTSYFGEINSAFTTSVGAGRKLKSNFYYGLGVFYNSSKNEMNPDADIPDISDSSGYVQMQSYVHSLSTDHAISPFLFFQYFYDFTDWFSIAFDAYARFDFYQNKTKKQILNFGIRPSLRFKLYKNFGLDFTFGILEYSLKIKDSRQDELKKKTETLTNRKKLFFSPSLNPFSL